MRFLLFHPIHSLCKTNIYQLQVDIEYPLICRLQSLSSTHSPGFEDRSIRTIAPSERPRVYT